MVNLGTGMATFDYTVNGPDIITDNVPEPLTILGSGLALGFGGLFKRKYDQSKKALRQSMDKKTTLGV